MDSVLARLELEVARVQQSNITIAVETGIVDDPLTQAPTPVAFDFSPMFECVKELRTLKEELLRLTQ